MPQTNPLVSVIIPMFNSAKFISQTLESLIYQTMPDFEVLVVDDCSTDNSVEVVKNFAKRFGGRLRILTLPKNTAMPGLLRNFGIQRAHGKYIAFLDSDDFFTPTALAELTTLAEKFQADVVRTNNWFSLWNGKKKSADDPAFSSVSELTNPANYTIKSEWNFQLVTAPILEPYDISARVKSFTNKNTFWTSWLSFYRRDFLIGNEIFFPKMLKSEDASFILSCFLLAKKFLRVPNAVYINRPRAGSISKSDENDLSVEKYLHQNILPINQCVAELQKVMNRIPAFNEQPTYRYDVLDFFFKKTFSWLLPMQRIYAQNPAFKLNELVKKEFSTEYAELAAYLFGEFIRSKIKIKRLKAANDELKNKMTTFTGGIT